MCATALFTPLSSLYKTNHMLLQKSRIVQLLAALLLLAFFTGCLKDSCKNSYTIYRPVYKSLTAVRNEMKWEAPRNIEMPGKIYLYGKYLLVNDVDKGIHVFDNSAPAAPKKLGFLRIPGNVDMAIRNNVLYADSYADLAAFSIGDWNDAKPIAFRNKVFADRNNYWGTFTNTDSVQVIVSYEAKDTVVDCETVNTWRNCTSCIFEDAGGRPFFANASAAAAPLPVNGTGGSMARFTLVNDYLYTVTNSTLSTFAVSDAQNPVLVDSRQLGWNIETIFPFANKLFIGSATGMFIYDLANPAAPEPKGTFSHARVCDPVIAEESFAFVTLRSGQPRCGGIINQLDVVNIANLSAPKLLKSYPLTNPHGLSKDGDRLFVCDGSAGLKVFDATDPSGLKLLQAFNGMGETFDVIAHNNIALVVAKDGLYQYDYTNRNAIKLISKIAVSK